MTRPNDNTTLTSP